MSHARFRFSTEILARLGEELNPSLDQGVLELVKNAHDADAGECVVHIDDSEAVGGTLTVHDTGDGMTGSELRDKFLLLGASGKDVRARTRLGRIPAGSKGLGRLAALRAGAFVTVTSRPASEPRAEYTLNIDWQRFDQAQVVDEVELEIVESKRAPGAGRGTTIEVRGLTRQIGRREMKRLARALLLLADPFGDDPDSFRPVLQTDTFRDLAELVRAKYFDAAEYHLRARLDEEGQASAQVLDWQGKTLFEATHQELRGSTERYVAPSTTFDFWVFILDAKTFSTRSNSLGEVREWLREFGGVMLYINGLRVPPYGDSGNDWLDLNLRRTQSPEERPSTLTSIGRLQVTDLQAALQAKTDRGGLIENDQFDALRAFAKDSLEWMARRRLEVAESRRQRERQKAPQRSSRSRDRVERAIAESAGGDTAELVEAFSKYDKAREREVQTLRDEVQLYRTLSTAGITAATFAHESSNGPLKVIGRAVATLRRRIAKLVETLPSELLEPLDQISNSTGSLLAFGDTTLDLIDKDKRRSGRVDVDEVVERVMVTYQPFLVGRQIAAEFIPSGGRPYLQGSVAAVESVVVNLITNAMTALAQSTTSSRRLCVMTEVADDEIRVRVGDNGSGLQDIGPTEIWLPGRSTRTGGSGLGLTIVRDTVNDLGGRVVVVDPGVLGGAEFIITIPVLGA